MVLSHAERFLIEVSQSRETLGRSSLISLLGKKSKNVFRFFEFRLEINFFHFRLGCFEEVDERLGWPEAGVEIGTG